MTNKSSEIRDKITELINEGNTLLASHVRWSQDKEKENGMDSVGVLETAKRYHNWYTRALAVIRQLVPDRLAEFQQHLKIDGRRKIDGLDTYTISDYLTGLSWFRANTLAVFASRFHQQIAILESCLSRLDNLLADIQGVLQAGLLDDQLATADELLKKDHLRAAGAVAGVALEGHLQHVTINHKLTIRKKNPIIADFNDSLKDADVLDVPNWRFVQRLGDIRNLCAHSKEREPTRDEVDELIRGAEKVIKTVF